MHRCPLVNTTRSTAWRWIKEALKRAQELGTIAASLWVGTQSLRRSATRHWLAGPLLGRGIRGDAAILRRSDVLRQVPTKHGFLSVEPLLEELGELDITGIAAVIVGGESGTGSISLTFC